MIPTRLLASGIHLPAIFAMSASAAFVFHSSFLYERWLSDTLADLLGWYAGAFALVLLGIFVGLGLLLSFMGRMPGLFALILFLFFLPSLYAHSSLDWLQFADLDVEPNVTEASLVSLGVIILTAYLLIRTMLWISDAEQDFQRRGADAGEVREASFFSVVLLIVALGVATGVGLALAFSAEPIGGFLQGSLGGVPAQQIEVVEKLKESGLGDNLSEQQIGRLADAVMVKPFFSQDISCDCPAQMGHHDVYILLKGLVTLDREHEDHHHVIEVESKGSAFDFGPLLGADYDYVAARAIEGVEVLALDSQKLLELFDKDPVLGLGFTRNMGRLMVAQMGKQLDQQLDLEPDHR